MPLPEETRTLIVSLMEQEHYHEARQEMDKAWGAGISKADLEPLQSRLNRLVDEEQQEREAQAEREREAQAERERQAREQLQRQLAQLGKQMDDALAKRNWQRANELFGQATDLASSVHNQPEWQNRWETLRRGPIKVLLESSRAKLDAMNFEQAVDDAEAAAELGATDQEAKAWLNTIYSRVGAGLLVQSDTPEAVVKLDGKLLGAVGTVFWHLPEGQVTLVVDGEQYMPGQQVVNLVVGEVCKISESLQPAAKCKVCRGKGTGVCRKCSGTGKGICPKCNGRRTIACPHCKGKWKNTCTKCRGSGKIRVRRHLGSVVTTVNQTCPQCGGKGYRLACHQCNKGRITCPLCGGTRRHGKCHECKGTGQIACPRCSGVGKVPATQPAGGS